MLHTQNRTHFALLALALLLQTASAQSLSELTRQALAANSAVSARRLLVQEAVALARSAGSPLSPELEVAPGIGYTNGNFALHQPFDLSGSRAARARRAKAEIKVAQAVLRATELNAAHQFHLAYAQWLSGNRDVANAEVALRIATDTLNAVQRRVELGEAPEVQAARAQIELRRAEQDLIGAHTELAIGLAAVSTHLRLGSGVDVPRAEWQLNLPTSDPYVLALAQRPEALQASAALEVAGATEDEVRRQGRPTLAAGITSDAWSLDRRPFPKDSFGIQIQLSMPLLDRGAYRHAAAASKSATEARVAEHEGAARQIRLDVKAALAVHEAAKAVEENFRSGIVPAAEAMLTAMQDGFRIGLVTFLEVLEAQRALADLRREASKAKRNLHEAEANLMLAVGQLPVDGGVR